MFKMNLHNNPFQMIKNKTKTIEMRLNDERRKNIKVGDLIEFRNRDNNQAIYVEVINIYKYQNFDELYKHFDKVSLGYKINEKEDPSDMLKYYSKEDIEKYGVLAINIKLLTIFEVAKILQKERINNTIELLEEFANEHMEGKEKEEFLKDLK